VSKSWQTRVQPRPDEIVLLLGEARRAVGGDLERWLEYGGVPYGVEAGGCCGPAMHWFEHDRRGVLLWRDSIDSASAERVAFRAWCDASDDDERGSLPAQTWAFMSWGVARRLLLAERQPQQLALFAEAAA